jgi:transposase-like protein
MKTTLTEKQYEKLITRVGLGAKMRAATRRVLVLGQGPVQAAEALDVTHQAVSRAVLRLRKAGPPSCPLCGHRRRT